MNDEINTETEMPSPTAPAVIESMPEEVNVPQLPTNWQDLTDSQKIDILHHKIDMIGANVDWIGKTFQGVINMVGSISPMDLFKMMRGGK
jgi:hypothetical protein